MPHPSQDRPYSPSALAALWAPNPTDLGHLLVEEQNSLPYYQVGQPDFDLDYDMATMEQANYNPPIHPDLEPVPANIEDFYRHLYNIDPNLTILSSSQERELCVFNKDITTFFSDMLGYEYSLPWDDHIKHQFCLWQATTIQTCQIVAETKAARTANVVAPQPTTAKPPQSGAIKLFPNCPPSAPPITTINSPKIQPLPISTHSRPSPGPWKVAKGPNRPNCNQGNDKPSFAQAMHNAPQTIPITVTPHVADLSDSQLNTLSHDQLIRAVEVRFQVTVQHCTASKVAYIRLYKTHLTKEAAALTAPAPTASKPSRPCTRPVVTSKYTITRRPDTVSIFQPKTNPAIIVCKLQRTIRQHYNGVNSPLTLLSGRWGSNLSHNFILTFAGKVDNVDVVCIHKLLIHPFGPRASIVPQQGYMTIMVHSIPVLYHNRACQTSEELHAELEYNVPYQGLTIISQPRWLQTSLEPEKVYSSIIFAFLDVDGLKLATLTKNLLYLFGLKCRANLFNSLPLVRECGICHCLNHSTDHCSFKNKNVTICHLCGGHHPTSEHYIKCPTAKTHTSLSCTCTPFCINCKAANLKSASHICTDTACPLCKCY